MFFVSSYSFPFPSFVYVLLLGLNLFSFPFTRFSIEMENLNNSLNACVPSFACDLHVLLVDHDTSSLHMVASMLEQYSFKVTTAEKASAAVTMIQDEQERSFNLVVADVYLKDMNILRFMGMVLKKEIPIILMTSGACVDVSQKVLAKGASFCYEKPISLVDLRHVWQHVYKKRNNPIWRLSCNSQGSNGRAVADMNFRKKPQGIKFLEPSFSSNATPRNNFPVISADQNWTNVQLGDIVLFGASNQQVIAADPKGKRKLSESEFLDCNIDPRQKNKQLEVETCHGNRRQQMINYSYDPSVYSINGQLKSFSQGKGLRRGPVADQENGNKGGQFRKNLKQIHSVPEILNHEDGEGELKDLEDGEGELKDQRGNTSKKRKRAVWTRELHFKFTTALSLLGDKKATPKAILGLMNVPDLTQRQVASHLQKYKEQVKRISEATTTTLPSASNTGALEASAKKNSSPTKEQSQRGFQVGGTEMHPLQELFGYNSRFPVSRLSFNERLKFATSYINAKTQNELLFPIQGQNTMLGRNVTIADKHLRNLPVENKELQTIEASAPPALANGQEMMLFADMLKMLEEDEDTDTTKNLAGQPDLPVNYKELQTPEDSAPPALVNDWEMILFADMLKGLEEHEEKDTTENLAGQPDFPLKNKELQTPEDSAPPALAKDQEMRLFADMLKAMEEDEDTDTTKNLAGQPDQFDIDQFFEWLEEDTP